MRAARQTGKLARRRRGPPEFGSALAEAGRKGARGEPAAYTGKQVARRRAGPRFERHRLRLNPDFALGILPGRTSSRRAAPAGRRGVPRDAAAVLLRVD